MNSKELYSIREWAPLTDIMEKIPVRMIRALGIFPADLNITCVDAISEFIALGSDAGIVFWYDRYTGELQKLRTEFPARITCVKIVNSVEYMVAAGNGSGQVSVFQIQKQLPPDLNLVAPCARVKPIERYNIRDLHSCAISCVEWSKNGMKLYSGDRQGIVVLTEFDFQAHISKSTEILSEAYEIVQLSVFQSYLLVSTLYRSIVCQFSIVTGQWQVTQVGKKDRKVLSDCGGIFLKQQNCRPVLICGRPGLRFWIADTEGNVEKTLLFREAVARSPSWEIPILNPKSMCCERNITSNANFADNDEINRSFGAIQLYKGDDDMLIVTHDESTLYLLNLDRLRVEAVARGFRKILDFCVCDKEIFVLEGTRSLLRLAPMPEKPSKTAKIIFNPSMPPPVPLLGASIAGALDSPAESFEPPEQPLGKAEECFELPPVELLNLNVPIELAVESPRAEQNRRLEIFNQISEMDFDQSILHHSGISQSVGGRKKRSRRSRDRENALKSSSSEVVAPTKSQGIVEIGRVAEPETDLETPGKTLTAVEVVETKTNVKHTTTQPTLMNSSFCATTTSKNTESNQPSKTNATLKTKSHCGSLSTPLSPASPDKQKFSIKPKSLAEELNLAGVSFGPKQSSLECATPSPIHSPPAAPASTPTPMPLKDLAQAYPKQTKVEDAGVQTTPRKKLYYMEEADAEDNIYSEYTAGQPIDDLCHAALRAATLVEEYEQEDVSTKASVQSAQRQVSPEHLQFVCTQPVNEEINSFLPDFRRACDPYAMPPKVQHKTPPPSAESNGSSSEWEFLDN
ncbi:WD repeat-containing protein CG11141 [Bactrocera neohumeralis]|uniref:WD repeat-containing protein CG11141 n=1 Tax=Bactrocera neohumeralis TaxID=98809 RepID=UPI0021668261|nr:WD repeat-containing protein CG11141 [Bactrocera neohumeralis]